MRREGIERIQNIRPDVRVVRMADTIHDIPLQRPAQLVEEILRAATNKKIADLES
jgi:hypothetical protein